jgi:tRNA wybutosine-synthesizing protein 3
MTDLIPPSFQAKKQKIVSDLALPDEEYSDLSPKGSVDENIRPLIRDINRFPGLVTTSSCAGRISVFLEGGRDEASSDGSEGKAAEFRRQAVSTGGKGGGRWLFVSHDPVSLPEASQETTSSTSQTAHKLFGLTPGDAKDLVPSNVGKLRLVRFHFEPMVRAT